MDIIKLTIISTFLIMAILLSYEGTFAQSNIDRGIQLYKKADFDEAKKYFEKTITESNIRNRQIAYAYLALLASADGNMNQVDRYFSKILELRTSFDLSDIEEGVSEELKNRYNQAKQQREISDQQNLTQEIERQKEIIKKYKDQITALENKINELRETIGQIRSDSFTVGKLEKQIKGLAEENNKLKVQLKNYEKEMENLKKEEKATDFEKRLIDEVNNLKELYTNLLKKEETVSSDDITAIRNNLINKLKELRDYYKTSVPEDKKTIEAVSREIFIYGKPL